MKFLFKIFLLTLLIFFSFKGNAQELVQDSVVYTDVEKCYGDSTGTITIYVSGGNPDPVDGYYYSIDGESNYTAHDDSVYTFTGLPAGIYEIWIKDQYISKYTDYIVINEPDEVSLTIDSTTNVIGCFGDDNGVISLSALGGTGVGTFDFFIDNGAITSNNTGSFDNLSADTYSIYVRDDSLCQMNTFDVIIGQPSELLILTETVDDILGCPGTENGKIVLTVSGGTGTIEYSIDNGVTFQGGGSFSNLTPGNYNSVVRDSEGCTLYGDSVLTITEPSAVVIDTVITTDVTGCYSNDNGEISITAYGGSGTLSYSIYGGMSPEQNGGNFTNLFAGTYNVYVKDENGCGLGGGEYIITQPDEIIIDSVSKTDIINCFGDLTGTFTINAHGGNTLEYCVDPGLVWQDSKTITNLAAGNYTPYVRDKNDPACIFSGTSLQILEPKELLVSGVTTNDVSTCFVGNDGSIHITTNGGGTFPHQFSIDGGSDGYPHSYDVSGLSAGSYNIIVTDANNCTDTLSSNPVEIFQPDQLIIDNSLTQVSPTDCYGSNEGSIEIFFISGYNTNTIFSIDGGATFISNPITNLEAGTYVVYVENNESCSTVSDPIIVGQPTELIIDSIMVQNVIGCHGDTTGSIVIHDNGGGTLPINYSINSWIDDQASNIFNNLGLSSNHIIIKDANNCSVDSGTYVITQPESLLISSYSGFDIEGCHGDSIGEIHFTATGGTEPFQYFIDSGTYSDSEINGDFSDVPAGDYQISVSDFYNCIADNISITISEPDELIPDTLSTKNMLTCFGDSDGSISMKAFEIGGQPSYEFSIESPINYQSSSSFQNLTVGTYQTWVKDNFGCERIGPEVIITQLSLLEITSVVSENINGCFGDDDGKITRTANGGTPGYMYTINLGSSWYDNGGAFTNLSPGDYFVRIQDANNCETTYLDINSDLDTITIIEPDLLEITGISKVDFDCFGDDTGEIHISAIGGTGVLEYFIVSGTYSDSNNTGDFTNLPAEEYMVHVEDANACFTQNYPIGVYEPPLIVISNVEVTDETCPGANDGTITIHAEGGTWPYDYSADGITYQHNNRTIENLAPGDYIADIFDTNTCKDTADFSVNIAEASFTSIITSDVTEGCSPLTVNFSRLNAGNTYSWNFGDGSPYSSDSTHTFENLTDADINYTVRAFSESSDGCRDTVEIEITVYPQAQLLFTAAPQVSYFPDAIITIINDSLGMTNYQWDFGDGTTSTDEQPGSHTYDDCGEYIISLEAVNSFNCPGSYVDTITITAYQPQAFFEVDTTQHCTPFAFNFENQSTFTESFEWVLDDGTIITDNDFSNFYEIPGTYNITLNAYGYCDTFDSYDTTITVFQSPIVEFDVFPDTVMLPDQLIHCVNNSSDDGELFFWEFGDGGTSSEENPEYQYTTEGSYPIQLTVITVNKCIDSLTYYTEVIVLPEGNALFPTGFTPNGDGINDVFKPAVSYSVESFKMKIYNRWGELVFYTEDINEGWTGYYDGVLSLQDVYVWRAEGIYINGTPFIFAGSVTLLR